MVSLMRLSKSDLFDNIHIGDILYYYFHSCYVFLKFEVVKITAKRAVLRPLCDYSFGDVRYLLNQNFTYYYKPVFFDNAYDLRDEFFISLKGSAFRIVIKKCDEFIDVDSLPLFV